MFFFESNDVPKAEPTPSAKPDETVEPEPAEEDEEEEMLEFDTEGCVEPDTDEPQQMGDVTKTPTEEECDKAGEFRSNAAASFSEQNFASSVAHYTEAIQLNPTNSLFYAKRGQAFLKLNKPNACIRDCDRALELNCDSAAAYKFRGRAHRLLGNWESAAKDLRQACKIDFDEDADEWLREVTPNAKKIEQHKIKMERKQAAKELKERQERVRKAQEAHKKAAEDDNGDFNMYDPEILEALKDVLMKPENISKYANNPKVMKVMAQFMSGGGGFPNFANMAGAAGAGGGFPGAGGGFPGAGAGFPGGAFPNFAAPDPPTAAPKPPTDYQDDGLD